MRKFKTVLKAMLMVAVIATAGLLGRTVAANRVSAAGTEATLSQTFKSAFQWHSEKNKDGTEHEVCDAISFQKGNQAGYNANKASAIEIQDAASSEKIYMWHDTDLNYYWYSPADTVYLPENSSELFESCSKLASFDANDWNTSRVTNMTSMFAGCSFLNNADFGNWDTSNVTSMKDMFAWCSTIGTIDGAANWDTSKVTDMSEMFNGCGKLTSVDVSNWNTSKVTDMSFTFRGCEKLPSIAVGNWDTSSVINMNHMFTGDGALTTIDVSKWNTSKVTDMGYMFQNCWKLASLDVSNWNMSNVEGIDGMFSSCIALNNLDVSNWDTSNVVRMNDTFNGCKSLTSIDVSKWNTSKVENMGNMFMRCANLTTVDVSKWNTSSVTNISLMFSAGDLTKYPSMKLSSIDVSHWDTSNVRTAWYMFYGCPSLESIDMSGWVLQPHDMPNEKGVIEPTDPNCNGMFEGDTGLQKLIFSADFKANTKKGIGSSDVLKDWYKVYTLDGKKVYGSGLRDLETMIDGRDSYLPGTWVKWTWTEEPFTYGLKVTDERGNPITDYTIKETDVYVYDQNADKTGYYTKTVNSETSISKGTDAKLTYPDNVEDWRHKEGDAGVVNNTSIKDPKSVYTITIVPKEKAKFKQKTVTIRTVLTDGLSADSSKCEIDGATFDEADGTLTVALKSNNPLEDHPAEYGITIFKNITGDSIPGSYSFQTVITPDNANCPMPTNTDSWYDPATHTVTIDNSTGGRARGLNFQAYQPGTYGYTVKEVNGGKYGWDYDTHTYHITYTVDNDGKVSITQTVDGNAITDEQKATNAGRYKAYTGSDPASNSALVASTSNHFTMVTPTGFYDTNYKPLIAACAGIMAVLIAAKMIKH